MIHLDFESRSRVDIYAVGAWEYSIHPSTEILCLAYAMNEGSVELILPHSFSKTSWINAIKTQIEVGQIFATYNALFEQCMWQNILVKKYGWPRIPIKQWRCVMAKSLACALPRSLSECAKTLNSSILKDEDGKRIMLKLSKPNAKGQWNEDPKDFEKLYQYCINDVNTERAIDKMLPDLTKTEQVYWFLDQLINQRGAYVDIPAVEKALSFIELYSNLLNKSVGDISHGELSGVSRRMEVLQWCQAQGVDIKGYTRNEVTDILRQEIPDNVRAILNIKLALGKTSVAKYSALSASTFSDGRIRDLFIYHGATTGRWTGKLFQIHNLPKGNVDDTDLAINFLKNLSLEDFEMLYPDVMGTLSSCLRGMIIASPGHELFIADYNAIEARGVMWLANENHGLDQFRKGIDIYVEMARNIYSVRDINAQQRALGKATVLGSGFGMGAAKFLKTCANWGIPVTEDLAQRSIKAYRELYPAVRDMWYAQESAAIRCVETKQDVSCGKVQWQLSRDFLLCVLPSGRSLKYPFPSLRYADTPWGEKKLALHFYAVNPITKKWELDKTYGGKIVENLTQAVARDILAAAMLRVENAGYKVLFSVHDEIVSERKIGEGDVKEYTRRFCDLPIWAEGFPVVAEAWCGKRYKK